jgi:hypothetical protein
MVQMKEILMLFVLLGKLIILYFYREGEHFISGGDDKLVKLWGYDDG